MKALKLTRLDFDNLENRDPHSLTEIGLFVTDGRLTAHYKIDEWLAKQEPVKLYMGYDGKVYPQWSIKEVEVQ